VIYFEFIEEFHRYGGFTNLVNFFKRLCRTIETLGDDNDSIEMKKNLSLNEKFTRYNMNLLVELCKVTFNNFFFLKINDELQPVPESDHGNIRI
jgi:hypothetical protein